MFPFSTFAAGMESRGVNRSSLASVTPDVAVGKEN